ncbi:putative Exportin-2 [Nannochloris sp. 'desiccata']|nr:putative Exportin-2 [Chlorella desiccata (nom. nud.)]
MAADLKDLHSALAQTLAPDPALIKQAEAFLKAAQAKPGFGISILQIVTPDDTDIAVRQQGAVQFKNFVKYYWSPRDAAVVLGGSAPITLTDEEKEQIKTHIIDLMLSAPPRVRSQLSEALTIISQHDFPRKWEGLLPQLIGKLTAEDPTVLNGVLTTVDSIYHRYRGQFLNESLNEELQYSQTLVKPLLAVAQRVTAACTAAAAAGGAAALPVLLDDARLILSIFHSLNSPGLTEEFENTLKEWMECIHALLILDAPAYTAATSGGDAEQEGPLDALKATACECLSLFMALNEEEFAPHLEVFVRDVWRLLISVGPATGQDHLAMAAITFLTTVAKSVHFGLFGDAAVLKQVCEGIVIPNLKLRDEDVEVFEMNWVEWVRRDTEGGDSDTRRRAASELVRALVDKFPAQTTELFSGYVAALLAEAVVAPEAAWRAKDAAIYLVSALAVKGRTAAAGATSTNSLVNLQDFYASHVAPELAAPDVDARPVVKADCLRFATTFRSQLSREAALDLFPKAASLLASTHNVVHSYAAMLVERLLAQRINGASAFTSDQLGPYLQPLLERLFAALRLPESGENEYVMRAVMRLVTFVGAAIAPVAAPALQQLCEILLAVARNPTQPGFNHYLFESIAALVKFGCQPGPSVAAAEDVIFPPFQVILQEDVQEFHPYVFQILAQLIELRSGATGLPETYLALVPPLLIPTFWERAGNIPALGRLVRAYISTAPSEIASRGLLPGMLGVFQKLVASKAQDHEGMAILDNLTLAMEPSLLSQYMPTVWNVLFQRIQVARTPKIVRCFLHSASLMSAKQGGAAVAASMDTAQQGIHVMVVQGIWAPALTGAGSPLETKVAVVGSARMLCEAPGLQGAGADGAAAPMLVGLLQRVATVGAGATADEGAGPTGNGDDYCVGEEEVFSSGYAAAYAKLQNAAEVEKDFLAEVADASVDVAQRLAAWSLQNPGTVGRLLASNPDAQTALGTLCQRTGVAIA